MSRPGRLFVLLFLPLLMAGVGCTPSAYDYQYVPRPAVADIPPNAPQGTPPTVAALASVGSVGRDDPAAGIPPSAQVRVQVGSQNWEEPVEFDLSRMRVSDGSWTPVVVT